MEKNRKRVLGTKNTGALKGDKMDTKKEKCQVSCYEACEESNWVKDPEDVLLDLDKMTPEEMKEYLDSLLRNRSLGR